MHQQLTYRERDHRHTSIHKENRIFRNNITKKRRTPIRNLKSLKKDIKTDTRKWREFYVYALVQLTL